LGTREKEKTMYKVTERRLKKAEPILERFRMQLQKSGKVDAHRLELDLRECWNVGYQEMKWLAMGLAKLPRFRFLAVYYMENSNTGGRACVASEFKGVLARIYGVKAYHSEERDSKRDEFWKTMQTEK